MIVANILIYAIGFIFFILSITFNDIWLSLLGIPFMLFLCSAIHEIGHCIGCIVNRNTITELYLPLFSITAKGLKLNTLKAMSYCSFKKRENNIIVYALGPVFSMFFTAFVWCIYVKTRIVPMIIYGILSFCILLCNVIPFKNGDMRMIYKEIKK